MEAGRLLDRLPSAIRAAVVNEECRRIRDFSPYCCQFLSQWQDVLDFVVEGDDDSNAHR
jgi:hypothetical protein